MKLPGLLLLLSLIMMVLLPGILLDRFGIFYTRIGGAMWEKIHPSTYICLLAVLAAAFARADPMRFVVYLARQEPRVMLFFAGLVAIALTTFMLEGIAELGFLLDTFFVPAMIAMILSVTPPATRRLIFKTIVALVIANAIVGIVETALQEQFIPPTNADGSPYFDLQFRPWALLQHPLNNALVTATTLIIAYPMIRSSLWRLALLLLLLTALFAFGGRAAFAGSVAALTLMLAAALGGGLLSRRFTYGQSIYVLVLVMAVPMVLAVLLATTNIGERIADNLSWDSSAETRLQVYRLLDMMSGQDLWFGIGSRRLAEMSSAIGGQGIIIENFWLVLLARLGLLQFVLFVAIFALFLSRLWQGAAGNVRLGLVLFMLVASTNNSLSVKGNALSLITALILCAQALRPAVPRAMPQRPTLHPLRRPPLIRPRLRPLPGSAQRMTSADVEH